MDVRARTETKMLAIYTAQRNGVFIIYIRLVVTDGSVIQYLVYFCCCVDNINFNRNIIMKNYRALGRVIASV